MRGLVPQDGLFGGSGTAGLGNERGSPGEGLLIVPPADSLLTLPSPLVLINGRFPGVVVLAQRRCSGERGGGQRGARAAQRAWTTL